MTDLFSKKSKDKKEDEFQEQPVAPPADIFSSKSVIDTGLAQEDEAFVVSTEEAPDDPMPVPIEEKSVAPEYSFTADIKNVLHLKVQQDVAKAEVGLSIAAGTVGFMLGGVNAGAGMVKNLFDYGASGTAKLALTPFKDQLPDLYDAAQKQFLHDVEVIPQDMMDDFNIIANNVAYEPHTEYANRYVVDLNNKLQAARQYIGDAFAGVPNISEPGSENFETDSLEELKALQALDDSPTGILRKVAGAAGQSAIDVGLMVVGGLFGRGMKPGGVPTKVATVEGLSETKMTIEALDALDGSKPKFSSYEEAAARIEQLATGKARQTVVVEATEGLPTKVISGQDVILAMKELRKRGVQVKELKIKVIESSPNLKADVAATKRANNAFEVDRQAEQRLIDSSKEGMKGRLTTQYVDASGNVKASLLKEAGELGEKAVRDLELTAGATPRAIMATNDAWHRIFRDMSNRDGTGALVEGIKVGTERQLFDQFARAHRIIAIEKSKLGKLKKPKFEAGTSAYDMANWLKSVKDSVGEARYAELSVRAEALFEVASTQLKKYLEEGLISTVEYNRMKDINYMKTEFIDQLDPTTTQTIGGKTIQVGDSGIQAIGKGSTKGALLDAEALMNEMLIRTENRISRNRASKRLYDIAIKDPKNSIVKLAKKRADGFEDAPPGWDTVKMMVAGQQQAVHMPEWLAQQWRVGDPAISATAANIMRIVSGAAVVRPLATGYNPGFVITNMPRDIVHAWLATNNVYSRMLPRYLLQLGQDMLAVSKDSLTKTGRYRDYINEGGGLSFLTHQGREIVARSAGDMAIRHHPKMKLVRDALSYVNEQSEILTRLAIRERVLRNQKERGLPVDPVEATWQARRYLDFAQGGSVIKVLDNAIPYLNATTQAYRTVAKAAKRNPAEFAAKAMQLAGLYAGWEAYNMLYNQEPHTQIPEKQRRQNFIIHTGEFIIDEEGNKRYEYYQVKKDQSTVAPTVWLEQLVDLYISGKPPTDNTFEYMMESLPGLSGIPIVNAAHTYLSDYNFWYNEDIFGRDLNIEDYAKFKGLPMEPTDEVFKDFGAIFNLKPEALQQATNQVIPNNTYMQAAGKAYDMMFADADPRLRAQTTEERMARMPFVNRVYKLTHPAAVALDEMDRLSRSVNTDEFLRTQKLKELIFEANRSGDYNPARKYAGTFINEDPFLYKDMMNRIIGSQRLQAIFKDRKQNFEDLPKTWWLGMLNLSPKARAEVYFEEWSGASGERKRFMDSTAGALSSGDLNFIDQEFSYHLSKLKNSRNTVSMEEKDN